MGSSKNSDRSIDHRSQTLLDRLHQALNLGTWHGGKWRCKDIQIQRQVLRSFQCLLDSVSKDKKLNPLIKDSISAGVKALVSILEHKNVTVLSMVASTALKLVSAVHAAIMQSYTLDLVGPLSSLLPYHQIEVSILCAKTLDLILLNPTLHKNEKEVWDILKRTETIGHAISNMHLFSGGTMQIELFQPMASLVSTVLRRWPLSRFPVYNDAALMRMLSDVLAKSDSCGKVEVLKLLSSIALCGSGAAKLLENGESLVRRIVQCMATSQPHAVRIEGFRLARRLAVMEVNEERFCKMKSFCCESLVQATISGMSKEGMDLRKGSSDQISLIRKACNLALVTRWEGEHHALFWKHGISKVLLSLLKTELPQIEQISMRREFLLIKDKLLALKNSVWAILGWLAIHCEEDFNPDRCGSKLWIDILITATCYEFMEATLVMRDVCVKDMSPNLKEFPTRAIFMMIYSPCKYIASMARSTLSELYTAYGQDILKAFMTYLEDIPSRIIFSRQDEIINLMALACYIGLPEFQTGVLEFSGLKVLLTLVSRCLSNPANAESLTVPYSSRKKTCCGFSSEGWEGKDLLLFFSLWGLAELMKRLKCIRDEQNISSGEIKLVEFLQGICVVMSGHGVRWFASYALSSLGLYGFPSALGKRVGKAIRETGHADTRFILKNGECVSAHSVVLAVRCPSLLGRPGNTTSQSSVQTPTETSWENPRDVRLSGSVTHQVLLKILDFMYFGCLEADQEEKKLLKAFAKSCKLVHLLQMLCRERPKWGTPFPEFDIRLALSPLGFRHSDVILESKTSELQNWKCDFCSSLVPHFHAHKIVLASMCRYMWALFYHGMRESFSRTIKLDISWGAMVKLVAWFYTDKLPSPSMGCLWEYMSDEEKLQELEPYLELCWLFDYWLLEDIKKACLDMVVSRLESARQLSVKIIKIAARFYMWELVKVATFLAAPLYHQFRDSGELDDLDEDIVQVIRSASVQQAQATLDQRSQSDDLMD